MMRGMRAILVAVGVAVLLTSAAVPAMAKKKSSGSSEPAASEKQTSSPEEIKTKFKTFCDGWMEKLRERERNNVAHIDPRDSRSEHRVPSLRLAGRRSGHARAPAYRGRRHEAVGQCE